MRYRLNEPMAAVVGLRIITLQRGCILSIEGGIAGKPPDKLIPAVCDGQTVSVFPRDVSDRATVVATAAA